MSKFDIKKKYDEITESYIKFEHQPYMLEFNLSVLRQVLTKRKFDICIDIGCGSAALIRRLAVENPTIRFIGYDFCESLLLYAKDSAVTNNVEFYCADIIDYYPKIQEELDLKNKSVLLLLMGPMEHYHVDDAFTKAISVIWNNCTNASMVLTYHNKDLFMRSILKRPHKKYWTDNESIGCFQSNATLIYERYFHFLPFAVLVSNFKIKVGHFFFLFIEKLLSYLPKSITKRIFVGLLHVFSKETKLVYSFIVHIINSILFSLLNEIEYLILI